MLIVTHRQPAIRPSSRPTSTLRSPSIRPKRRSQGPGKRQLPACRPRRAAELFPEAKPQAAGRLGQFLSVRHAVMSSRRVVGRSRSVGDAHHARHGRRRSFDQLNKGVLSKDVDACRGAVRYFEASRTGVSSSGGRRPQAEVSSTQPRSRRASAGGDFAAMARDSLQTYLRCPRHRLFTMLADDAPDASSARAADPA